MDSPDSRTDKKHPGDKTTVTGMFCVSLNMNFPFQKDNKTKDRAVIISIYRRIPYNL